MRPFAYSALAIAPIIAALIYIYFSVRSSREYTRLLAGSYFTGLLSALLFLAALALSATLGLSDLRTLKRTLFFAFITIGGSSELGKYLIFRYYVLPRKEVERPFDAILFSIMNSLGFSTMAVLFHMLNLFDILAFYPPTLILFVYVPASILFSVIMGFFLGMAKFTKARIVFYLTGLLGAAFFNGFFTFCLLTSDFKMLSLFSFGSLLIVLVLALKAAFFEQEASDQ